MKPSEINEGFFDFFRGKKEAPRVEPQLKPTRATPAKKAATGAFGNMASTLTGPASTPSSATVGSTSQSSTGGTVQATPMGTRHVANPENPNQPKQPEPQQATQQLSPDYMRNMLSTIDQISNKQDLALLSNKIKQKIGGATPTGFRPSV